MSDHNIKIEIVRYPVAERHLLRSECSCGFYSDSKCTGPLCRTHHLSTFYKFFIGPRSDHSLRISLTEWLTDDLVEDGMNWPVLMESKCLSNVDVELKLRLECTKPLCRTQLHVFRTFECFFDTLYFLILFFTFANCLLMDFCPHF